MTDTVPNQTRTLTATCLCTSSTLTFTVPNSSIPFPTHFCHCSICRHTHGTLASIHAPIPALIVDLSTFTAYRSSERVTRYFCSTCGAHFGDCVQEEKLNKGDDENGEEGKRREQWYVAASMVLAPESTWDLKDHFHVGGTGDGGLATWLKEVGGRRIRCWREKVVDTKDLRVTQEGDWTLPVEQSSTKDTDLTKATNQIEKIHAHCHCNGVSFYISRPRSPSDFPDPSLTPKDKSKWFALHDVCDSCRLVTGCAVVSWVFPTKASITVSDGSPYTPVFGTAKAYKSSEGVLRTFCGVCGATVFFQCNDRPEMVDVAAGLLDGTGVRCEEWLEWRTWKIAFGEDLMWKEMLEGLQKGLGN